MKLDMIYKKRIGGIIMAACVFFFVALIMTAPVKSNKQSEFYRLTTTFVKGDTGEGEAFKGCHLNKGESVTFSTILPDEEYISPTISFMSDFCEVDVAYNGESIYRYGNEEERHGSFVPKRALIAAIPSAPKGGVLAVTIKASISTTYNLNYFYYGESADISTFYVESRRLPLFVGIFVCTFGLFILITIPILRGVQTAIISMLFHGLLLMDLGVYFLGYNSLLGFVVNDYSASFLEYASLLFLPFLVQGAMIFNDGAKRNKLTYFFMIVDFLVPVIVLLIHFLGLKYIQEMVIFTHALISFQGAYCVIYLVRCIKTSREISEIYGNRVYSFIIVIGVNIFFITSYADLIAYYIGNSMGRIPQTSVKGMYILFGAIELVICMVLSYFFHHIAHINEDNIRDNLEGLAYRDELTDVSNRAHCEQVMERMTRKKVPCIVVSIDLDGLKKVNDNLGHQIGDRMIKGFAAILKDVYSNVELLGRMGGDEFIVIMKGRDVARCESLLSKLKLEIAVANDKETEFRYSASWGYAGNHEVDSPSVKDIYMLADTRMYAMKDEHHRMMAELSNQEVMS